MQKAPQRNYEIRHTQTVHFDFSSDGNKSQVKCLLYNNIDFSMNVSESLLCLLFSYHYTVKDKVSPKSTLNLNMIPC